MWNRSRYAMEQHLYTALIFKSMAYPPDIQKHSNHSLARYEPSGQITHRLSWQRAAIFLNLSNAMIMQKKQIPLPFHFLHVQALQKNSPLERAMAVNGYVSCAIF